MHILVTGGGGFLGRRIVHLLQKRGESVRILARSAYPELEKNGVVCMQGDLADAELLEKACAGVDAVFHVAAKAGVWGKYDTYYRANVLGTNNVLAACKKQKVPFLIHTSTPSVVYNGQPFAGADESHPLTTECPCHYPLTKAKAERLVLDANSDVLRTVALRPHLIWGAGDTHLVPRVIAQAKAGKLRIVGDGKNRVDLTHVDNAAHAHLLALDALMNNDTAAGHAYFISDGAPVMLWDWINELLKHLAIPPVRRRLSLPVAHAIGGAAEALWKIFPLSGEPPMTRFVAIELAKDHWFDIGAARRDISYRPIVTPEAGLTGLLQSLLATKSK